MRIVMRHRNSDGGDWKLVESKDYGREVDMHRLLVSSPSLIPTDELPGTPSPFVVAVREFDLPGAGSTDIVLFNPQGNVAVVECKLAYNVQIKREVIGQILEYASCLWRMSYAEVDARVQHRLGQSLADLMRGDVTEDADWDEESFRRAVQNTLDTGAFNLIIAVDEINEELSRTIGFLNGCGQPAFTFHALALPRFESDKIEILVPDLHGPTGPKDDGGDTHWTEARFQREVGKLEPAVARIVRDLHEWNRQQMGTVRFGYGVATGSTSLYCQAPSKEVRVFTAYTSGKIDLAYGSLGDAGMQHVADALNTKLRSLPGFASLPSQAAKYPSVLIADAFVDHPDNLREFKDAIRAAVASIDAAREAAQPSGGQP